MSLVIFYKKGRHLPKNCYPKHAEPRKPFKDYTIKRIKIFFIALLVLLMTFTGGVIWYLSDEARLKKIIITSIESRIKSHVTIAQANISFSGLSIYGLNIYTKSQSLSKEHLVFEVGLTTIDFNILDLLLGSGIEQATIEKPTMHLCYDHNNKTLNVLMLEMLKKEKSKQSLALFNLDVNDAIIKYYEKNNGAPKLLAEEYVQFHINDDNLFELKSNKAGILGNMLITGTVSAENRTFNFNTTLDVETIRLPQQDIMGVAASHILEEIKPMGRMNIEGKYSTQDNFHVEVTLDKGAMKIPNRRTSLSHQLTDIDLSVYLNNGNCEVKTFSGRLDDYVDLAAYGEVTDLNGKRDFAVHVETVGLVVPSNQWEILSEDMVTASHERGLILYDALPDKIQAVFDKLKLTGAFDIVADVKKPSATNEDFDFATKVIVKDATLSYIGFPYEVKGIKGEVHVGKASVVAGPLVGHHGENIVAYLDKWWLSRTHGSVSEINISIIGESVNRDSAGVFPLQPDHRPVGGRNHIHVNLDKVAVDKSLTEAMPKNIQSSFLRNAVTGLFSGRLNLGIPTKSGKAEGKSVTCSLDMQLEDGTVAPEYLHYPLNNVQAHVEYNDNHFMVSDCQGFHDGAKISGNSTGDLGGKFTINLSGKQIDVDPSLVSELARVSNRISKLVKNYKPSGFVDTDLIITGSGDGSAEATVTGDIHLNDVYIDTQAFENNFGTLNGTVKIAPGKVLFSDVVVAQDVSKINVSGEVSLMQYSKASLHVVGRGIDIQSQIFGILPDTYKTTVQEAGLKGITNFNIELAYRKSVQNDLDTLFEVTGSCGVNQGYIDSPLSIDALSGMVKIVEAQYWPNKHAFNLVIQADAKKATIYDILFTDAQCDVRFDSRNDNTWRFEHIDAVAGSGKVMGDLSFTADGTKVFQTELVAHDVDLSEVFSSSTKNTKPSTLGILEGCFEIDQIGDIETRQGDFEAEISNARWGRLPLGVGLFKILHLKIPDDSAFNTATVSGVIQGDDYYMQNIVIMGDVMQIVGGGQVEMPQGEVELGFGVFTSSHPITNLPLIKQLSEFIQKLSPVQQFRASGDVYNLNKISFKPVVFEVLESWLKTVGNVIPKPVKSSSK